MNQFIKKTEKQKGKIITALDKIVDGRVLSLSSFLNISFLFYVKEINIFGDASHILSSKKREKKNNTHVQKRIQRNNKMASSNSSIAPDVLNIYTHRPRRRRKVLRRFPPKVFVFFISENNDLELRENLTSSKLGWRRRRGARSRHDSS